jgi:hypothetical protein
MLPAYKAPTVGCFFSLLGFTAAQKSRNRKWEERRGEGEKDK